MTPASKKRRRLPLPLGLGVVCACVFALVTAPARAQGSGLVGSPGTVELGVDGLMDLDSDDETAVYVDTRLGYFFSQGIEAGLDMRVGTTRMGQRDRFGGFAEYDYVYGSSLVPFMGLALQHAKPARGAAQNDVKILALHMGANYVVATNVALSFTLKLEYSDEPYFSRRGRRKRRNQELDMGFRFYL